MSNDQQDNTHPRGHPFSHTFNIGTTIQNVFRNINHAFASNHDSSGGQQRENVSQNADTPESLSAEGSGHDMRATHTTTGFNASLPAPNPNPTPISSASSSVGADMPPSSQFDSQRDDDEESMPELHSMSDLSDASDTSLAFNPVPHPDISHAGDEHDGIWIDMGEPVDSLPHGPVTGTRRARVDDDDDDARDRRHPSERVGGSPPGEAGPQNTNPQQPRLPAGFFGALFGMGPPGGNHPGGDPLPEHTHTGDPSLAGNNAAPGQPPRGPILTAGFTLTIPLFGPPGTGAATGGQGGIPVMSGMDAATREEFLASFAAFFQEFQALDETREDPERAKKLVAGLEVVPLGLVQRLERVGGAPGGHVGDTSAEGSSSGCAICWDTLLNAESDSFTGQQSSGDEVPQPSSTGPETVERQADTHTGGDAMDVDAPSASVSPSDPGTSASAPPSSEPPKIISLPCAHVFHASCLLPWFTRAKQATCPTCRFNVDPENLTYTPLPRPVFNRAPPAQPDNANPNPAPAPQVPAEESNTPAPPVDLARTTAAPHPAAPTAAPGQAPQPPTGQAPGADLGGFFVNIGGVPMPMMTFPPFQVPPRPGATQAQTPGGGNQGTSFLLTRPVRPQSLPSSTNEYPIAPAGIDFVTIGLDMFIGGGPSPEERGDESRDNAADGAGNDAAGNGPAGRDGAPNPNGLAQDLHSLFEGLVRTTRNIIPQAMNAQGQGPAPDAAPAEGAQPQPQARPAPEGVQPQPTLGGPRVVPIFPFRPNMFRPTRPMPPRRERKTWTVPPAPGPSLRQRVEQREREQGLRCSDTSCGVGPSDDDPYPEPFASSTKQLTIRPLSEDGHASDCHATASVCAHAFHPACLVSAERVAGWGCEDKDEAGPLVEVSCPVCRAVGCVTREEWASGVTAL